jgi:hypothetical protein
MKPPGIMFCTPSGRFEINKRVCLTISDFHPETWSPLWTVGSILTGIVSFMNSEEMTTGGLAASSADRKAFAVASAAYNAKDKVYVELFGSGEPLGLFQESAATMQEFCRKRKEKSQMSEGLPKKAQGAVAKAAAAAAAAAAAGGGGVVEETKAETESSGPSKSAKKRAKEKEKSRRLKEEAGNEAALEETDGVDGDGDGDGDVSGAAEVAGTEAGLADMKLSGDGR